MRSLLLRPRFWVLVLGLALATGSVRLTHSLHLDLSPYYRLIREAARPAGQVLSWWQGAEGYFQSLEALREENRRLKAEAGRRSVLEWEVARLRQENARLKELLDYRQSSWARADLVAARIISRSPDQWLGDVVLDRGRKDGVEEGAVAVGTGGLAGRVVSAGPRTSLLRLLTDPSSAVGVVVYRNGQSYPGIVEGTGAEDRLKLKLFSRQSPVEPGDPVFTAPWSERFPPGIPVGRVASRVQDDGRALWAVVSPHVDFLRLEEVLVLIRPVPGATNWTKPERGGEGEGG